MNELSMSGQAVLLKAAEYINNNDNGPVIIYVEGIGNFLTNRIDLVPGEYTATLGFVDGNSMIVGLRSIIAAVPED